MNHALKDKIKAAAQELGIDKIGFTTAAPFDHLQASIEEQHAKGHSTGFEHPVLEERLYPERIFNKPKSIISNCVSVPKSSKKSVATRTRESTWIICESFMGN